MTSSQLPVLVIGAGLAGLTLARSLIKNNVPAIVFESAPKGRHAGHGLNLREHAYRPLCKLLELDEAAFRRATAVDAALDGNGAVKTNLTLDIRTGKNRSSSSSSNTKGASIDRTFRANKRRLRERLTEGVDIRWEHKFASVTCEDDGVSAKFENGQSVQGSLIIAADGVHSAVRKEQLPSVKPEVLPYVAINGQRKVSYKTYQQLYRSLLGETASIYVTLDSGTCLGIAINDATADEVYISYTYSRPPKKAGQEDPLYTPDRSKEDAKQIPEALFQELESLGELCQPFREVFDPAKVRQDRLLSWLMRSVRIPESSIDALHKRVGLLGDAAHAPPIISGWGGEIAILDGIALAEALGRDLEGGYRSFVRSNYSRWQEGLQESERSLARLHKL